MNAGGEGNPKSPENQTPQSPEAIQSSRSEVDSEPVAPKSGVSRMEADSASADYGATGSASADYGATGSASADYGATGSASGATKGLPPDQPLPAGAEMLRRASGSSIDSFSGEGGDLNLLVAEQFQPLALRCLPSRTTQPTIPRSETLLPMRSTAKGGPTQVLAKPLRSKVKKWSNLLLAWTRSS
jgi:hypothetical protein